jgi:hypothetical protein
MSRETRTRIINKGPMPMILYQPATLHSDSIKRPNCSDCGTATHLFGIEAERPGYELLTFVCPRCNHIETAVGKVA